MIILGLTSVFGLCVLRYFKDLVLFYREYGGMDGSWEIVVWEWGERERRDNFHFQKGLGMETQIAAALPEHPVWYSIGLHMFFLLGMRACS